MLQSSPQLVLLQKKPISVDLATNPGEEEITITGLVTDDSGEPMIGVTIYVKNTLSNGTITDFDGTYQLSCEQGDTLVYNYIGYVEQTRVIATETVINLTLKEDSFELNEQQAKQLAQKQ